MTLVLSIRGQRGHSGCIWSPTAQLAEQRHPLVAKTLFSLVRLLGITCYGICTLQKNIPWVVRDRVLSRGVGPKG